MKQKIALVLSGGGARGIAHIGVIEELEKRGYEITSIAGTSMGSLVGGIYALGMMGQFKEWICKLDKRSVFGLVDFALSKQGLIRGDKVFRTMKTFIPDTKIEQLPIPFTAVAVDLIQKEEVLFRKGSLYDAIRASVAIPSVFTPVKTGKRLLVDGGVMNNIPVNHVQRTEGDLVVAVNVNAEIPVSKPAVTKEEGARRGKVYQERISEFRHYLAIESRRHTDNSESRGSHEEKMGYFSLLTRTIDLMTMHMADLSLKFHEPDILINVSRDSCHVYDFYKAEEMLESGREAAVSALDAYRKFMS